MGTGGFLNWAVILALGVAGAQPALGRDRKSTGEIQHTARALLISTPSRDAIIPASGRSRPSIGVFENGYVVSSRQEMSEVKESGALMQSAYALRDLASGLMQSPCALRELASALMQSLCALREFASALMQFPYALREFASALMQSPHALAESACALMQKRRAHPVFRPGRF